MVSPLQPTMKPLTQHVLAAGVTSEGPHCCICFSPFDSFVPESSVQPDHCAVRASCNHEFGKSCIERHLLFPSDSVLEAAAATASALAFGRQANSREQDSQSTVIAPSIGPCPYCRATISLFDLRYVVQEPVSPDEQPPLAYIENKDPSSWPMSGCEFVEVNGPGRGWGIGKLVFQPDDAPYFSVKMPPAETKKLTVYNARFHTPSKIFSGCINRNTNQSALNPTWNTLGRQTNVLFQFSNDCRFIRSGLMVQTRQQPASPFEFDLLCPMDGTWETTGLFALRFTVSGGLCQRMEGEDVWLIRSTRDVATTTSTEDSSTGLPPSVLLEQTIRWSSTEGETPHIRLVMIDGSTMLEAYETMLPVRRKHGSIEEMDEAARVSPDEFVSPMVEIGGVVVWRPISPDSPRRSVTDFASLAPTDPDLASCKVWRRVATAQSSNSIVQHLYHGARLRHCPIFRQRRTKQTAPPTYNPTGLVGNVFCQESRVGLASYHFIDSIHASASEAAGSEEPRPSETRPLSAYISYEHPSALVWPPLDDGNPVPGKVFFRDPSFDREARIFRGSIHWHDDYGTTWSGDARWDYEMHFDSQFLCIKGGQVKSVTLDTLHDPKVKSQYTTDLFYVNAGFWSHVRAQAAAVKYTSSQQEEYTRSLNRRLVEDQATGTLLETIQSLQRQALSPDDCPSPIDCNNESDEEELFSMR
jgi:hypothetical protein